MSSVEYVETPHGQVEYETVRCSNCQSGVVPEEAVDVAVGERVKAWEAHSSGDYPEHVGITRPGGEDYPEEYRLCKFCAEAVFGYEAETGSERDRSLPRLRQKLRRVSYILFAGFWFGLGLLGGVILL